MATESGTSVRGSYISLATLQKAAERTYVAELAGIHPLTILRMLIKPLGNCVVLIGTRFFKVSVYLFRPVA